MDGAVVQQRELADHLAGPDLDLVVVDGQTRRPLLDQEQPGPDEARLDEDVPGRRLELEDELGDGAQVVALEVGEHRHGAEAVGELLVHGAPVYRGRSRGTLRGATPRHALSSAETARACVPSTRGRAILVRQAPVRRTRSGRSVWASRPLFFGRPMRAGDRTERDEMVTATKKRRPAPSGPHAVRRRSTATVRPIAESVAESHGLVLWGITFLRDAGRETLRVAVDRVGGVSADELARCSEQLSRELDRSDVVPGDARYVLEVTSPGAERKLEGAEQFRDVRRTRREGDAVATDATVEGTISDVTEHAVEIDGEDGPVRALFSDIAKAQLVVKL